MYMCSTFKCHVLSFCLTYGQGTASADNRLPAGSLHICICISEGHNSTIFVNKAELSIMLEEILGFRLVQTEVFAVETPLIQVLVSPNR